MKKFFIPLAAMAVLIASSLVLNAQTGVDNYVSASGFVLLHAPSYYTGNDGYCYDFENDYDEGRLLAWTTIDAGTDYPKYLAKGFVLLMNAKQGLYDGTKKKITWSSTNYAYWSLRNTSNRYLLQWSSSASPSASWTSNQLRLHVRLIHNLE